MPRFLPLLFLLILLAACAPAASPAPTPTLIPTPTVTASPAPTAAACNPAPLIAPTLPAVIPSYTQLDESTGLHITGEYRQVIDPISYRLKVTGKVDHTLSLSLDELRCMPKVTATPTLICQGNFEDVTTWSGVPLKHILDLAGLQSDAKEVLLVGADDYKAFLTLKEAQSPDAFLAYEWKGQPIPILHGFPLRAVMPSMRGSAWANWVVEIRVQ